jgi:hypothetical protein
MVKGLQWRKPLTGVQLPPPLPPAGAIPATSSDNICAGRHGAIRRVRIRNKKFMKVS